MKTERFYEIRTEMDDAFLNDEFKKAETLALEYLVLAESKTEDWNYGNAIHHANLMLGRLALKNGNIEDAKIHLLKAGKTKGSPQLNSFGPNMSLAKELLEKGEEKVVLEYINYCKVFWKWIFAWRKTWKWKREIVKGKMPYFGGHLNY